MIFFLFQENKSCLFVGLLLVCIACRLQGAWRTRRGCPNLKNITLRCTKLIGTSNIVNSLHNLGYITMYQLLRNETAANSLVNSGSCCVLCILKCKNKTKHRVDDGMEIFTTYTECTWVSAVGLEEWRKPVMNFGRTQSASSAEKLLLLPPPQ